VTQIRNLFKEILYLDLVSLKGRSSVNTMAVSVYSYNKCKIQNSRSNPI